jgi:S-adenosylmethionine hydrolase
MRQGVLEFDMPLIALLTDFGLHDYYLGAMKGAILAVCPEATLVDIVHELPPHDVAAGALALDGAYRFFPAGTVFVAVVDPGVGSERRPIGLRAASWLFVGPDNGLFTYVLDAHPTAPVRLLADERLCRTPVSAVFHGRDVFGPAGAHLARGFPLEDVGPAVADPVRLPTPAATRHGDWCEGAVLRSDRFGNVITNLLEADLDAIAGGRRLPLEVVVGGRALPLVLAYSEVPAGQPCALVGSGGRLEIAVNRGRADALPGTRVDERVVVRLRH